MEEERKGWKKKISSFDQVRNGLDFLPYFFSSFFPPWRKPLSLRRLEPAATRVSQCQEGEMKNGGGGEWGERMENRLYTVFHGRPATELER